MSMNVTGPDYVTDSARDQGLESVERILSALSQSHSCSVGRRSH